MSVAGVAVPLKYAVCIWAVGSGDKQCHSE